MEPVIGYACGRCDTFAPLDAGVCAVCGAPLGFGAPKSTRPAQGPQTSAVGVSVPIKPPSFPTGPASPSSGVASQPPPAGAASVRLAPFGAQEGQSVAAVHASEPPPMVVGPVRLPVGFKVTEALMEQARSYVCKNCYTPVPQGHKFCGRCGTSVPREVMAAQTMLLSKMLEPGKAKLVVIKGEGVSSDPNDETVYLLGGRQHVTGRTQGQIVFDKDTWVSPRHANFYYREDGKLIVKDEGSVNGVYVRLRQPVEVQPGDMFLAGEQAFRLEAAPRESDQTEADGTYFYSSPKRPAIFRIAQVLRGGLTGMLINTRDAVAIGRDGCDMNFPNDAYMSGRHCKVEVAGSRFTLSDSGSKNGTYVRIRNERELSHGDYVFIGRELLRVDISA
jgi:pSer/pThr/pTyr-binding forkhead associated (FHA) protein/RNA polymerase subunit RPABC4/transcription elongation factor Spt4